MSFNAALSSGNYDSLRGTSTVRPSFAGSVYLSLCPNTTIYSARVNQASFANSFAQVTYDGGSGTLANVRADMTILFSRTNSAAAAYHVGRVRKTPTSSIFYINETSADIQDNDYIFVLDDYRMWDKLHRVSGSTILLDYDITFRQLLPIVYNLKSGYAGEIADGDSSVEFSFAPLAVAATSGATISTWAWSVGDGTITVGSSSTQNITATFPAGHRWIHLTVTDSGGRAITRHIPVWVHDDSYPVQLLAHDDLEVNADLDGGYNGSVTAFDGLETVLDNTLVCAWGVDTYNGTATSITGDNIILLGRLRQSDDQQAADETHALLSETRLTIEGPMAQLARLQQLTFEVRFDATPTIWGDIKDLTIWRAVHFLFSEFSTFENLHSLSFSNSGTTYRFFGSKTQGGNILAAVNDLAESINAALQMNGAGIAEVNRHASMIDTGERELLVTVANWTTEDVLEVQYQHDHVLTVGRVQASGGSYNTTSGKIADILAIAPGVAQNYADGQSNLARQILTANASKIAAQNELRQRAGFALAKAQTIDRLTITHPDGYYWLTPSCNQWYTFTLDAEGKRPAFDTTTRWLLVEITTTHSGALGTKAVQATYIRETTGPAGQAIEPKPTTQTPINIPMLPPTPLPGFSIPPIWLPENPTDDQQPLYDEPLGVIPKDGNAGVCWASGQLLRATNMLKTSRPNCEDITPDGLQGNILQFAFDPFGRGGYLLDGTQADWCYNFDFTASNGSWSVVSGFGSYSAGVGWRGTLSGSVYALLLERTFSSRVVKRVAVTINVTGGLTAGANVLILNSALTILSNQALVIGTNTYVWSGTTTTTSIRINPNDTTVNFTVTSIEISGEGSNPIGADNCGSSVDATLWECPDVFANPVEWTQGASIGDGYTSIEPTSTADVLYAYSPIAETKYSTDRGATWAAADAVGSPPGSFGGIAAITIGAAVLAGADNQVMIATSGGGAYSAYGSAMPTGADPNALLIPRRTFGSTTGNNSGTSTPEYLVASAALTAGNAALWKVTASGATFTDITPTTGGQYGKAVSARCLAMPWYNGLRIITLLQYGSNRKLAVSVNTGSTWAFSANLNASANWLAIRKGDQQMKQCWIANGTDGVGYCANYRAATPVVVNKAVPTDNPIIGVEIYG